MSRFREGQRFVYGITGERPLIEKPGQAGLTGPPHDSLLWGQRVDLIGANFAAAPLPATPLVIPSQQAAKVEYERPTTWTVKVFMRAQRPAGETATFEIDWNIQIGVGSTKLILPRAHVFTTPAPGTIEVFEQVETLPAQAINVEVLAIANSGAFTAGNHQADFICMVAPVFA